MQKSIFSEKKYTVASIIEAAKVSSKIELRYAKWTASLKYLLDQSYVDLVFSQQSEFCDPIIMHEKERISQNQRILLECEQVRVKANKINKAEKQKRLTYASNKICKTAQKLMNKRFEESDISRLAPGINHFSDLAAFAYGANLNFNKLNAFSVANYELSRNIIEVVNNSIFCEKIGKLVKNNKDVKSALGFIGIENCRMIYPVLMSKSFLKWSDENTKIMVPKMWQHSVTMANATRMRLQDIRYKEPDIGVLLGMMRGIGQFIISNNYTSCFNEALGLAMTEFRDNSMYDAYYACADVVPDLTFLPEMINKMEKKITRRLVEEMDWDLRALHIKNALIEDINDVPVLERGTLGAALGQGRAFAIFDLMDQSDVFICAHIPFWLANFQMDIEMITSIRKRDPGRFTFNKD